MRDTVGEELQRRWAEPWPWRSALAVALGVHVSVAVLLVAVPSHHRRSLQLPSVHVRMVAAAPPAAKPAAMPAPAAAPEAAAAPPQKRAPAPKPSLAPARAAARRPERPVPPAPRSAPGGGTELPSGASAEPVSGAAPSPSGAIGLGATTGAGGTDEPFPFTYYLARFIGMVESNWFRPPTPAGAHCRVRCRIDRSGRLLEAGIEEPSAVPAFDRAALRAVYSSAPFPPLPQGFAGQALTLHLDFGP